MRLNEYRRLIPYIIVSIVSTIYFAILQYPLAFPDPDSFYHVRIVEQIYHFGLLRQFPWLSVTALADNFTDHHLLYHLALLPWLQWFEPVIAVKLGHLALLIVLSCLLVYCLRAWRLPYAAWAVLFLYTISPFIFRINLIKATPLALILWLGIVMALLKTRYRLAGFLTALYTWAHGGFILALVASIVVWLAGSISKSYQEKRLILADPRGIWWVLGGMILGFMVNPYFPNNVGFIWEQFVQIGVINYRDIISVGAEWYPYKPQDLLSATSILAMGIALAILLSVKHWRTYVKEPKIIVWLLFSAMWLVATLRSRRYVEYLVPSIWLWMCYILLPYIQSGEWRRPLQALKLHLGKLYIPLVCYFAFAVPFGSVQSLIGTYQDFAKAQSVHTFAPASNYIRTHAQSGSIVFHTDWDDFPVLYFHNPESYYIVGLDPTFMYLYDRNLYQQWRDIADGQIREQVADTIYNDFKAEYVFIDRRSKNQLLNAFLYRDPRVRLEFEDVNTRVYHIIL